MSYDHGQDQQSGYVITMTDGSRGPSAVNVYCIGRNYAEHAAELNNPLPGEPVVFLKTASALRPLAGGELAFATETFHHEAEVVLLVGAPVALGAAAGWAQVRALGLGLDLTRREVQAQLKAKGLPWTVSKSFAGSGVLTEFVPLARFPAPDAVRFALTVNGERRQDGDLRSLLFTVPVLLTHLARHQRLVPGDLVFTGTPKGVGPVRRGDRLRLEFLEPALAFDGVL